MEHKLIEGGEKYLALARSEIKRLRATGLPYATKRLVFPDATVRVQVIDDIDFIHITGGGTNISMDSGVVAAVSIGEANPATKLPGTLYETTYVQRYNAPFVLPNAEATVRLNPNTGNTGQFSGILKVTGQKFKGKVPIDVSFAKSFDTPSGEAAADWGDAIANKKTTAVLCPASMFTGKCRLYVQALYGAHMVAGKATPFRLSGLSGAPSLYVDNRTSSADAVLVATGCGVYLDKKRGNHWLFSTNGTPVRGWPLKAPSAVEALRKHLITEVSETNTKLSTLSEEDQEHLETYILSQCLPNGDGRSAFLRPDTTDTWYGASNPYSMGYSWHWNWDGTKADAVTNTTVEQDVTNSAMQSLWHKATITQSGAESFEWSEVGDEPDAIQEWSVWRALWCIAEPNWGAYTLTKTTPQQSIVANSPGLVAFYVFYRRNELVKCQVFVGTEEAVANGTTFTNGATGGVDGSNCVTFGTKEGTRKQIHGSNPTSYAKFTVGNVQTPDLSSGRTTSYNLIEVKNKVFTTWINGFGSAGYGVRTFDESTDDDTNYRRTTVAGWLVDDRQTRAMSFDTSVSEVTDTEYGIASVVVPLYDAEAAYLYSSQSVSTNVATNMTYHMVHNSLGPEGAFLVRSVVSPSGSGLDNIFISHARANGAFVSDDLEQSSFGPIIPDDATATITTSQKLLCHAGTLDAQFTSLNTLFNSENDIPDGYYTLSGTKNDGDAVVIAINLDEDGGAPDVNVPVLVGWV